MISVRWVRLACVAMVVLGLARGPAAFGASAVEELSRRMPDEVIAFAGTSGGDALKGDFEKAVLGRIWNDKGVQQFYKAIKTELVAKASQESEDPAVAQKVDLVLDYVRLALSRPIVIGAAQVPVQEGPPVGGFAILDAGDRKAELAAAVSKLEAMIGQDGIVDKKIGSLTLRAPKDGAGAPPLYWGWVGNYLVVAINDAQGAAVKYLSQPREAAPAYLTKLPGNGDALALHGNYQKILRLVEMVVREEEGQKGAGKLTEALKRLGLSELKSQTIRVGFSGADVVAQSVLEMPTPATGVFAACKPIDLAWLGAVDARAMTASAVNWDLMGLYDTIMGTVRTVAPEDAYAQVQEAISGFESQAGLRIRGDLLASLAGPAVSYVLPAGAMPEAPMGGFVVMAKLKDTARFEKAMTALGEFAGEMSGGMLQISSQETDGQTVHVWAIAPLAMAGMMPTWSIASDHVVLGSNQELCNQGIGRLVSKETDGKSLLEAEGYKKVAAGLPANLTSFTYTDSQVQFNQTMMQMRQFWPMATMMASQAGFKLPVIVPSLTHIAKDMGPSVSYSHSGADGLYSYHRGPGIEVSLAAVAGGAVGAGVAMPALAKAREQARTTVAMSNLKQIGLALHMYAQDNNDKFPSNLEQAKKYYGDAKILESPRKPKDFEGPSYIYIPDQPQTADPQNVLAYENPEFGQEKVLVLFLDGHVQAMTHDDFQSELEATYERLGRDMPGEESEEEDESEVEEEVEEEIAV